MQGQPQSTETIAQAYADVCARITACENACASRVEEVGQNVNRVTLLAVSKTRTSEEVAAAYGAGARHFGENYLQDALPKLAALNATNYPDITWHFIGALQSNKTTEVATHFDWVHTVDREKIARRLANARPQHRPPLNICVQVNLHDEAQKAGISKAALPELLAVIRELPQLALRGLMLLPAKDVEPELAFRELAELFAALAPADKSGLPSSLPVSADSLPVSADAPPWDTLSMGMSNDYPAAIAAGSTMVRIGTALFGPRRT